MVEQHEPKRRPQFKKRRETLPAFVSEEAYQRMIDSGWITGLEKNGVVWTEERYKAAQARLRALMIPMENPYEEINCLLSRMEKPTPKNPNNKLK